MRRVHIIMFGSQVVINAILSIALFCGLLGENAIFAFVFPFFIFGYLLADMILTTLTTEIIIHVVEKEQARIAFIVFRDLLIILLWFCFLLYINIDVLTIWGTICYALPKILKIIICDIIKQQKYLHIYVEM